METPEATPLKETKVVTAIWAVDPNEHNLAPTRQTIESLRALIGGAFVRVRPVYVVPSYYGDLSKAEAQVRDYLDPLDLGAMPEPEILKVEADDRITPGERLLQIADRDNAELIILTSHGRSAISSFFLGSLAHELTKKSKRPLLFLNPNPRTDTNLQKVLFATDLTDSSRQAFQRFLHLVRGKTTDLILFHCLNLPIAAMGAAEAAGVSMPLPESFIEDQKEWAEKELARWQEQARQLDIQVRIHSFVEDSFVSAVNAIRDTAEAEKVNLVGLVSHVGPFERLAVGSVTNSLLSSQRFNLWVCGPHSLSGNQR